MNAYKFNKRAGRIVPIVRCFLAKTPGTYVMIRKNSPHSKFLSFQILTSAEIRKANGHKIVNINKMRVVNYLPLETANILMIKAGEFSLVKLEEKEELFP